MTDARQPDSLDFEALFEPIERRMYLDLYRALPDSIARDCRISWLVDGEALRLTCDARDHPFFNRVMGVGATGSGLRDWLAGLRRHYRRHGVRRWMLQVAPSDMTPELAGSLAAEGLVALRGWAKHAASAAEIPSPAAGPACDLRIEPIGPERAADWTSILAPAFQFPAAAAGWPAATIGRPGWLHYVAYDGDRPAACAAMFVAGGVATLTFAATHEHYRRRGAQSALIATRLREARQRELEWIVTETDDDLPDQPNPSYRNIVRAGMPVRYVRANWGPPPPQAPDPN